MVRKIIAVVLLLWSGMIFWNFASRGFSLAPQGGQAQYGHNSAYASGMRAGIISALVIGAMMFFGGLYLLLSTPERSEPQPERRKRKKRRKIVIPKPLDD